MNETKHKSIQVHDKNPGPFAGRVFVKRANMWLDYICYNTINKTDQFEWGKEVKNETT